MAVIYMLVPFPAGLAYGRAWLEWEAYRETLRAITDIEGLAAAKDPALHEVIVRRFTGPDYGWMWPFPAVIKRWIDAELAAIEAEIEVEVEDRTERAALPEKEQRPNSSNS